jgi:MFS family permease
MPGYLSSWPNLVSVVAVLGAAAAVARSRNKQRLIAAIFLLGRVAALGAAAVPWFPEAARVWALIGFWVLAVFPNSAAGTALNSFMADVFPGPSDRAKALAARNSWTTGAGMVDRKSVV